MIQPFFTRSAKRIGINFSTLASRGHATGDTPLQDRSKSSRQPRTANPLSVSSSAECIIEERWKKDQNRSVDQDAKTKHGISVASDTMVQYESPNPEDLNDGKGRYHCTVVSV